MGTLGAADLVDMWTPRERGAAHGRLAPLLALEAEGVAIGNDTLGARNQRLLAFHRTYVGAAMEARVACAACGTANEFPVPAEAILACPAPSANAPVKVGHARLRLPRMDDLEAVAGEVDPPAALLARCHISGALPSATAAGSAFEAADPAAAVQVKVACAQCGSVARASVDVAAFVAAALDQLVDGLIHDVDRLARAYGWAEREILALPAGRRRRYVALAAGAGEPNRPRLASSR